MSDTTFGSLAPGMMPQPQQQQPGANGFGFGGGLPMGVPGSYIDPLSMALAGAAQAMGEASRPSRLPAGLGSVIGEGAGGFARGALSAQQGISAAMQNQLLQASLPSQLAAYQALSRLYQSRPGGVGQGGPGGLGWEFSPEESAMAARLAMLDPTGKKERLMGPALGYLEKFGTQPMLDASGNVQWAPGALGGQQQGAFARGYGEAAGKLGPEMAGEKYKAGFEPPVEMEVPDPNNPGQFMKVRVPRPNLPTLAGRGTDQAVPSTDAMKAVPQNFQQMAMIAAQAANMPPAAYPWFLGVVGHESGWNPGAKGTAGEIGLGQVKPDTGRALGFTPQDLTDPQKNLLASARYWTTQWNAAGGNPNAAMAGYNRGDVNLPPIPEYVADVRRRVLGPQTAAQQPNVQVAGPGGAPAAQPQQPGIPGAIQGPPINTPQQEENLKVYGAAVRDQMAKDNERVSEFVKDNSSHSTILGTTALLRNLLPQVTTGTLGSERLAVANVLAFMGVSNDAIQGVTGTSPPSGEQLQKLLFEIRTNAVRTMGAREPGSVLQMYGVNYPGMQSRPETIDAMSRVYDMQYIYNLDKADAMQQWNNNSLNNLKGGKYTGLVGFDKSFLQTNNPKVYAAAAVAASGTPYSTWAAHLTDPEVKQALGLVGRVYPDARVLDSKNVPHIMAPPGGAAGGSVIPAANAAPAPAAATPAQPAPAPQMPPPAAPAQAAPAPQPAPQPSPPQQQGNGQTPQWWQPSPSEIHDLKAGRIKAQQFDSRYGPGAAARVLLNYGQ